MLSLIYLSVQFAARHTYFLSKSCIDTANYFFPTNKIMQSVPLVEQSDDVKIHGRLDSPEHCEHDHFCNSALQYILMLSCNSPHPLTPPKCQRQNTHLYFVVVTFQTASQAYKVSKCWELALQGVARCTTTGRINNSSSIVHAHVKQ